MNPNRLFYSTHHSFVGVLQHIMNLPKILVHVHLSVSQLRNREVLKIHKLSQRSRLVSTGYKAQTLFNSSTLLNALSVHLRAFCGSVLKGTFGRGKERALVFETDSAAYS